MSAEKVNGLCRSVNSPDIALKCLEILTSGIAASAATDRKVLLCIPNALSVVTMRAPTVRGGNSQFENGQTETNITLSRSYEQIISFSVN